MHRRYLSRDTRTLIPSLERRSRRAARRIFSSVGSRGGGRAAAAVAAAAALAAAAAADASPPSPSDDEESEDPIAVSGIGDFCGNRTARGQRQLQSTLKAPRMTSASRWASPEAASSKICMPVRCCGCSSTGTKHASSIDAGRSVAISKQSKAYLAVSAAPAFPVAEEATTPRRTRSPRWCNKF